jgi:hypothetical protein
VFRRFTHLRRLRGREAASAGAEGRLPDRAGLRVGEVPGRGECAQDAARPGSEQIPERRGVFGEHDRELRAELAQVILALAHQARPQTREFAQPLDLLVRDITGLGLAGAQEARDDVRIDVIGLALLAEHVAVAAALERVQDDDPIAGVREMGFEVFPQMAGCLEPDERLRRLGAALGQSTAQSGEPLFRSRDREALAGRFPVEPENRNPMLTRGDVDADDIGRDGHRSPLAVRDRRLWIRRTGASHRRVRIAWSTIRDEAGAPPSILDECSRPRSRGATFSAKGCSAWSPMVSSNQSSSPSRIRKNLNRTLGHSTRGIATTLAGASHS